MVLKAVEVGLFSVVGRLAVQKNGNGAGCQEHLACSADREVPVGHQIHKRAVEDLLQQLAKQRLFGPNPLSGAHVQDHHRSKNL